MPPLNHRTDLGTEFRALPGARGRRYWRSLEELAETPAFQELMQREFPEQASVWPDRLSRRQFLTLMGASLALAGLSGCSVRPAPPGLIVPYTKAPEEMVVPGRPLFFATAMTVAGGGIGLLVESHLGRPTKIEGNPDHPASLGATDVFTQASVLGLYDPDRSQTVTYLGQTRTWDDAAAVLRTAFAQHRGGAGVRLLTESVVSPTLAWQLEQFLQAFPDARWHAYEPINGDAANQAARQAFGEVVNAYYDFTRADVVVALDADFLANGPARIRYSADFMGRRRVGTAGRDGPQAPMNRLYAVEPVVSCTGAKADHRLTLRAGEVEAFARALAAALGAGPAAGQASGRWDKWVAALARDLAGHAGRSVVVPGHRQPAAVHLLAHAMNQRLGNLGHTVLHTAPVESRPVDQSASLRELVQDMQEGRVGVLVILGGNPVYTAPADVPFAEALRQVPLRFHHSLYQDETSRLCHWHLPEAHYLETWSDTRAYEGTATIVQPLIQPLYEGRSVHEVAALLAETPQPIPGLEIVQNYWREHRPAGREPGDFETFWKSALHDGVVAGTALPPREVTLADDWQQHLPAAGTPAAAGLELVFEPDPTVYDGRFANNGWLQELPKPITKLTWDNAALMSPATARQLGVEWGRHAHGGEHGGADMPVVELVLGSRAVRAPVWIMPGHADGAVTIHLGYGREAAGRVGGTREGSPGFNAYRLRSADRPWFTSGLQVRKTGAAYLLASTQQHHAMEEREPVRHGTLQDYEQDPAAIAARVEKADESNPRRLPLSLYPPHDTSRPQHKWGMAIDLTGCTGCSACVVACQAENNIPVVGKDEVAKGREMHWLRVDRYVTGSAEAPEAFYFQPVPCMHCEQAPCEYVCPVEATVHSADGLNDMIYNRCVGTRFCSNNCPYKVRRFNFLAYADFTTPQPRLQYNPDVTVRSRGVMEKCTYCVQRIRQAEIDAAAANRPVGDGEVLTACQAACPAKVITFGDINDTASTVKQWKDSPLNYGLLAELNTVPRTTYLAALRNPNPELEAD